MFNSLGIPNESSANRRLSRNGLLGDYSRQVLVLYLERP
jgi:hypothetical protein